MFFLERKDDGLGAYRGFANIFLFAIYVFISVTIIKIIYTLIFWVIIQS